MLTRYAARRRSAEPFGHCLSWTPQSSGELDPNKIKSITVLLDEASMGHVKGNLRLQLKLFKLDGSAPSVRCL